MGGFGGPDPGDDDVPLRGGLCPLPRREARGEFLPGSPSARPPSPFGLWQRGRCRRRWGRWHVDGVAVAPYPCPPLLHLAEVEEAGVAVVADDDVVDDLMPTRSPAARRRAVRVTSSGDGVGSPLGWLWTRITDAAASGSRIAARKTSRGWTRLAVSVPSETRRSRITCPCRRAARRGSAPAGDPRTRSVARKWRKTSALPPMRSPRSGSRASARRPSAIAAQIADRRPRGSRAPTPSSDASSSWGVATAGIGRARVARAAADAAGARRGRARSHRGVPCAAAARAARRRTGASMPARSDDRSRTVVVAQLVQHAPRASEGRCHGSARTRGTSRDHSATSRIDAATPRRTTATKRQPSATRTNSPLRYSPSGCAASTG